MDARPNLWIVINFNARANNDYDLGFYLFFEVVEIEVREDSYRYRVWSEVDGELRPTVGGQVSGSFFDSAVPRVPFTEARYGRLKRMRERAKKMLNQLDYVIGESDGEVVAQRIDQWEEDSL